MNAKDSGRKVDSSITVAASVEDVWRAITDPAELVRWFPFQARTQPGQGGTMWISWNEEFTWDSRIEVWEPPRRLRTVTTMTAGGVSEVAGEQPTPMVIEYLLETTGGRTTLRLVHSGFGSGKNWDDEFEGVRHGWATEMRSLRHYLENHAGRNRHVAWVRVPISVSLAEAWETLTGAQGLLPGLSAQVQREGQRFSLRAATGDQLSGQSDYAAPGRTIGVVLEGFNRGLFRVSLESYGGKSYAHVWISTWDVPATEVTAFGERWKDAMGRAFRGQADVLSSVPAAAARKLA